MIKPWPLISSTPLGNFRVFSLRSDIRVSPRTGCSRDFFIIDCANWVNVIALTGDGNMILIEQYRHGTDTIELEIPGGIIDPGDASPQAAGSRELREETGYQGDPPQIIGKVFPNPAIMTNTCYTVLIQNCSCLHPLQLDSGEDLVPRLLPVQQVAALVASNQVRHSLVVAALYHFDLWRRK